MTKYEPLYKFLFDKRGERLEYAFGEIEIIIADSLPESAYTRESWWANDTTHSVQARAWVDAGWRVGSVNLNDRLVRFRRF